MLLHDARKSKSQMMEATALLQGKTLGKKWKIEVRNPKTVPLSWISETSFYTQPMPKYAKSATFKPSL